jgi:hypothetical protein
MNRPYAMLAGCAVLIDDLFEVVADIIAMGHSGG